MFLRADGTAPATVTGERIATTPLNGAFPVREGGDRRVDPESQETGPLPSFLCAGGMNRADEGLACCGQSLGDDNRACVEEDT
ncbi:hypothetical protein SPHV1_530026 [Novosphingobium sp. KN65.2]|nr:hypothetical protein SPHV1_530026 [Novosphingobium sp. KN65.2]